MKLLQCPVNGLRPIQEFAYGGPFRPMPEPQTSSDNNGQTMSSTDQVTRDQAGVVVSLVQWNLVYCGAGHSERRDRAHLSYEEMPNHE